MADLAAPLASQPSQERGDSAGGAGSQMCLDADQQGPHEPGSEEAVSLRDGTSTRNTSEQTMSEGSWESAAPARADRMEDGNAADADGADKDMQEASEGSRKRGTEAVEAAASGDGSEEGRAGGADDGDGQDVRRRDQASPGSSKRRKGQRAAREAPKPPELQTLMAGCTTGRVRKKPSALVHELTLAGPRPRPGRRSPGRGTAAAAPRAKPKPLASVGEDQGEEKPASEEQGHPAAEAAAEGVAEAAAQAPVAPAAQSAAEAAAVPAAQATARAELAGPTDVHGLPFSCKELGNLLGSMPRLPSGVSLQIYVHRKVQGCQFQGTLRAAGEDKLEVLAPRAFKTAISSFLPKRVDGEPKDAFMQRKRSAFDVKWSVSGGGGGRGPPTLVLNLLQPKQPAVAAGAGAAAAAARASEGAAGAATAAGPPQGPGPGAIAAGASSLLSCLLRTNSVTSGESSSVAPDGGEAEEGWVAPSGAQDANYRNEIYMLLQLEHPGATTLTDVDRFLFHSQSRPQAGGDTVDKRFLVHDSQTSALARLQSPEEERQDQQQPKQALQEQQRRRQPCVVRQDPLRQPPLQQRQQNGAEQARHMQAQPQKPAYQPEQAPQQQQQQQQEGRLQSPLADGREEPVTPEPRAGDRRLPAEVLQQLAETLGQVQQAVPGLATDVQRLHAAAIAMMLGSGMLGHEPVQRLLLETPQQQPASPLTLLLPLLAGSISALRSCQVKELVGELGLETGTFDLQAQLLIWAAGAAAKLWSQGGLGQGAVDGGGGGASAVPERLTLQEAQYLRSLVPELQALAPGGCDSDPEALLLAVYRQVQRQGRVVPALAACVARARLGRAGEERAGREREIGQLMRVMGRAACAGESGMLALRAAVEAALQQREGCDGSGAGGDAGLDGCIDGVDGVPEEAYGALVTPEVERAKEEVLQRQRQQRQQQRQGSAAGETGAMEEGSAPVEEQEAIRASLALDALALAAGQALHALRVADLAAGVAEVLRLVNGGGTGGTGAAAQEGLTLRAAAAAVAVGCKGEASVLFMELLDGLNGKEMA